LLDEEVRQWKAVGGELEVEFNSAPLSVN
jgi:hypothetical protein